MGQLYYVKIHISRFENIMKKSKWMNCKQKDVMKLDNHPYLPSVFSNIYFVPNILVGKVILTSIYTYCRFICFLNISINSCLWKIILRPHVHLPSLSWTYQAFDLPLRIVLSCTLPRVQWINSKFYKKKCFCSIYCQVTATARRNLNLFRSLSPTFMQMS